LQPMSPPPPLFLLVNDNLGPNCSFVLMCELYKEVSWVLVKASGDSLNCICTWLTEFYWVCFEILINETLMHE
jgi:hypothetical protein